MQKKRFNKISAGQIKRPFVCGIFDAGEITYGTLSLFWQAIDYISSAFDVKHVEIQGSCCHSGFMSILKQRSAWRKLDITAVIDDSYLDAEDEDSDMMDLFCPPCDAVKNVGALLPKEQANELGIIKAIIDQADFCICNLAASPNAKEIREYVMRSDHAMLLDIGNEPENRARGCGESNGAYHMTGEKSRTSFYS